VALASAAKLFEQPICSADVRMLDVLGLAVVRS
jgi:hypothetical protein